ncbi:MAG: sensor histidine kinase [Halobacteria archaeon]
METDVDDAVNFTERTQQGRVYGIFYTYWPAILVLSLSVAWTFWITTSLPSRSSIYYPSLLTEYEVVLLMLIALFIVQRIRYNKAIYTPLMVGVTLIYFFTLNDWIDGIITTDLGFRFAFTDLPELIGILSFGFGLYLWTLSSYWDKREIKNQSQQMKVLNRILRHDVRNDMNIILARTDLLEDRVDSDELDNIEKIKSAGHAIVKLTETAGHYQDTIYHGNDIESIRLKPCIEEQVKEVNGMYGGVELHMGEVPDVNVKANKLLSSAIYNLLSNAVEHSDRNPTQIWITVEESPEQVVLSIADDGPGIPDDHKKEMLGKDDRGIEAPGVGMGLYLVHTLVQMYGGDVWIEDREPRGSDFKIRLEKPE